MSLTAGARFGGGSGAASDWRRAALLGASVGLHGLLLLGVVALGHRAGERAAAPVEFELMFEAPAVLLDEAVAPAVAEAIAPALPLEGAASAPLAAKALPEAAVVPVAGGAEVPTADVAPPPVSDSHAVAVLRRVAPVRVVAPERHVARPSDAPAVAAAPVAPSGPAPVRTVSISARWQGELAGWIRARTRYPEGAKQRGEQGAVVISFTVGRDGQVLDALLRQRSGSDTLDQAALAMFRAARVPAFPADMEAAQVTISVPVRYRLEP